MNSLSGHIRQSIALIITIGIVLLALCLYFFVYVSNKEAQVNERNFRILSRTTKNLSAKVEEYTSKHVAKNIIKVSLNELLQKSDGLKSCQRQSEKEEMNDCIARLVGQKTKGIVIEKLILSHPENITKKLISNDTIENDTIKYESGRWIIQFCDIFKDTFSLKTINSLETTHIITPRKRKKEPSKKSDTLKIYSTSSILIEEFIKPLLRTDIFKDYVILEHDTKLKRNTIIYATNQLGIADSVSNRIFKSQNKIATVELNGVTYLSFNYPLVFAEKQWLLAGLQKQEDYRNETRSLDRPLLYTLVLVLMLLFLALPMIKVIFISKNEKLNKVDIVLCGVSLLLGNIFCSLIIINLDEKRLYNHGELDSLTANVEKKFSDEIREMYNTILIADSCMVSLELKRDMVSESSASNNCLPGSDSPQIIIHWTDSKGTQCYKWSNKTLTNKIDVSNRGYFRNFKDRKAWLYPFMKDTVREYVLESILSWTDLEKKAVVSKLSKVDEMCVVGITKKLHSVIEPILPPGFKFCLADQQGNVWFHSDVRRNLNENIFEEIQMGGSASDVFYKSGKGRTCMYENREHTVKISVMKDFPLFLIAMQDLSVKQQSQAYTQEITFAFLGLHLAIVLLTIGLIKLGHRHAIKRLSIDWLKPDRSKSEHYVKIAAFSLMTVVLFLLLVFSGAFDPLEELFFLLTIPLCTMPLFFLSLSLPTYRNYYSRPSIIVYVVAALSVLALDIIFFAVLDKFPLASFLVQAAILILGRWFLKKEFVRKGSPIYDFFQNESNVLYFYTPAIGALLILIGVLPTVVFFQHAFNFERKIHAMVVQFEFAKQFYTIDGARKDFLQDRYPLDMPKQDSTDNPDQRPLQENSCFTNFYSFASMVTTKQPLKFLQFDSLGARKFRTYIGNRPWTWKINDQALYFDPEEPDPYNQVKGFTSKLHPFTTGGVIVWTVGIAALIYLLWLIHLLCSRVFLFKANTNLIEADKDLLRKKIDPVRIPASELQAKPATLETEGLPSLKLNDLIGQHYTVLNHLFLIGLPFSGKQVYLDILVPRDREERYYVDVTTGISEYKIWEIANEAKDCQVIIVDHFEYDLENPESNIKKLELLETLFRIPNKKVVVLSTVHPIQLFEASPEMESKLRTRLHAVLAHFYKIICPLLLTLKMSYEQSEKTTIAIVQRNHERFYEFIETECNHGLYLHNLKITLYNLVALEKGITIEELVVKIRSLAYNYYVSIWNCCTLEEQHLIYDLAEDGVVNGKNVESITRLVYKGIFIRENSLSLMNASFRDFVLSYVNPQEAVVLRDKVSKNGNWNKMRLSLFFVLAIVAFFLLYSQKGLSNQIMSFITALAAALPLLFRVLEAVSGGAMKKT